MNNTSMKKIMAGTALTAVLATSAIAGVSAMSDDDFRAAVIKQIQAEFNISTDEMQELETELTDISITDVLDELKSEIADLPDGSHKTQIQSQFTQLSKTTDATVFVNGVEDIYEQIDTLFPTEDEVNDTKEILDMLKEEVQYISDKKIQTEMNTLVAQLEKENNNEDFFKQLDIAYEKLDNYYGVDYSEEYNEEYSFTAEKNEIISYLKEEISQIKNTPFTASLNTLVQDLEKESNEDTFFKKLDTIYTKLDVYYEENDFANEEYKGLEDDFLKEYNEDEEK